MGDMPKWEYLFLDIRSEIGRRGAVESFHVELRGAVTSEERVPFVPNESITVFADTVDSLGSLGWEMISCKGDQDRVTPTFSFSAVFKRQISA